MSNPLSNQNVNAILIPGQGNIEFQNNLGTISEDAGLGLDSTSVQLNGDVTIVLVKKGELNTVLNNGDSISDLFNNNENFRFIEGNKYNSDDETFKNLVKNNILGDSNNLFFDTTDFENALDDAANLDTLIKTGTNSTNNSLAISNLTDFLTIIKRRNGARGSNPKRTFTDAIDKSNSQDTSFELPTSFSHDANHQVSSDLIEHDCVFFNDGLVTVRKLIIQDSEPRNIGDINVESVTQNNSQFTFNISKSDNNDLLLIPVENVSVTPTISDLFRSTPADKGFIHLKDFTADAIQNDISTKFELTGDLAVPTQRDVSVYLRNYEWVLNGEKKYGQFIQLVPTAVVNDSQDKKAAYNSCKKLLVIRGVTLLSTTPSNISSLDKFGSNVGAGNVHNGAGNIAALLQLVSKIDNTNVVLTMSINPGTGDKLQDSGASFSDLWMPELLKAANIDSNDDQIKNEVTILPYSGGAAVFNQSLTNRVFDNVIIKDVLFVAPFLQIGDGLGLSINEDPLGIIGNPVEGSSSDLMVNTFNTVLSGVLGLDKNYLSLIKVLHLGFEPIFLRGTLQASLNPLGPLYGLYQIASIDGADLSDHASWINFMTIAANPTSDSATLLASLQDVINDYINNDPTQLSNQNSFIFNFLFGWQDATIQNVLVFLCFFINWGSYRFAETLKTDILNKIIDPSLNPENKKGNSEVATILKDNSNIGFAQSILSRLTSTATNPAHFPPYDELFETDNLFEYDSTDLNLILDRPLGLGSLLTSDAEFYTQSKLNNIKVYHFVGDTSVPLPAMNLVEEFKATFSNEWNADNTEYISSSDLPVINDSHFQSYLQALSHLTVNGLP